VTPPPRAAEPLARYVRDIAAGDGDDEERLECKICLDAPRSVRFRRCGHCCVCADCYNELLAEPPERRKCPLCNAHIGDAHSVLHTQAAMQTFMASTDRAGNRQQRRAAELKRDKAQRVRKLSHAEERKALQRGRRTVLIDGATLLEFKGLYALLDAGGQQTTPFVKPPPVLPAPAPPRPPAPRSDAAADVLLRAAVGAAPAAPAYAPRPVPVPPPQRWKDPPLAAHYVVIVDHSGSMNAKDCLDECGDKVTRLEAAYDTLLNSYLKETRDNAPEGKDMVVSLVTMSTRAEVVFERYRLALAEDAIRNHASVAYARDHGNYLPALAEVERLFSQDIDAEGSHALGVVFLTDGKPSDTVTDPRYISPLLRGSDRIVAQLSWVLRSLEQKVDEQFPRFACNLLSIGGSRADFKILRDVKADLKRSSVDHSALDSSLLSSTMTSMATTMMSSVLETSVCAGRHKRTVRKVAQESADAAAAYSPRRPAEATDPFDAALPFLTPAQWRNFAVNDVTLDCLALLHDEDLDDLLEGDVEAKSSFRMRYPDPATAAAPPSVEEVAELARQEVERIRVAEGIRAAEEAAEDARGSSLGETLDVKDPHWLFSEPVKGATLWNGEQLAWRDFDAPRILAKRRKYFSDGAERLAYRGALLEPKTVTILEDVVFKESKFEEDHVIVKQEDQEDSDDDDDAKGLLARMRGLGTWRVLRTGASERDEKENAHSVYHVSFCKAQHEAGHLAVEFSAATKRWKQLPRVMLVTSSVYKFTARVGVQGELETTRVLGEPRLRGDYKKFTNNAGKSADFPGSDMDCGPVVEPKQRAQPQQDLSGLGVIGEEDEEDESDDKPERLTAGEVPQAFSHFSYEYSSGARMVCDLQGCFDRERGFELNDPCMLSKVGREASGYGRTDLGLHGLVDFFRTHKCTPLCKALGLTDARVREQELVLEESLRKKTEREASRAVAEQEAAAEKEKHKKEKADKRERRRAEEKNQQEEDDLLNAAAAENQAAQPAARRVVDRVRDAASRILGGSSAKEAEDLAEDAGFGRSKEGVARYKQSVKDRNKALQLTADRADSKEAAKVAKAAIAAMNKREKAQQRGDKKAKEKQKREKVQHELDERTKKMKLEATKRQIENRMFLDLAEQAGYLRTTAGVEALAMNAGFNLLNGGVYAYKQSIRDELREKRKRDARELLISQRPKSAPRCPICTLPLPCRRRCTKQEMEEAD